MRLHFHLAWWWEKCFFFTCFFLYTQRSIFFFCSAELIVDHCILSMHFSFFFKKTQKPNSRSFRMSPLCFGIPSVVLFFCFLPAGATLSFFFLILPSFVFEVGGEGRKNKIYHSNTSINPNQDSWATSNRNRYHPKLCEAPTKPNLPQTSFVFQSWFGLNQMWVQILFTETTRTELYILIHIYNILTSSILFFILFFCAAHLSCLIFRFCPYAV